MFNAKRHNIGMELMMPIWSAGIPWSLSQMPRKTELIAPGR
jgi:hypothetical protein